MDAWFDEALAAAPEPSHDGDVLSFLPRLRDGDADVGRDEHVVCGITTKGSDEHESTPGASQETWLVHAAACVQYCEERLRSSQPLTLEEARRWNAARGRLVRCWLRIHPLQRQAMGNGLGVPEALCLSLGYLERSHLAPVGEPTAQAEVARSQALLRGWNDHCQFAALSEFVEALHRAAADLRAVAVLWGRSLSRAHAGMVATGRPLADMTVIAIGMDASQEFDNRAVDLRVPTATGGARAAAASPSTSDLDRELLCCVVSDTPPDPLEPTELLRLATRITLASECTRRVLPCPRPVRSCWWHGEARESQRLELRQLEQHTDALIHRYLDESVSLVVAELMRFQLLSLGAVDYMARFSGLPLHALTGASALRFDHLRRVHDLALCQRLVTLPRAAVWSRADLPPVFHDTMPTPGQRLRLVEELRNLWILVLLAQELESLYNVSWFDHYVILPQEWQRRHGWCTRRKRWGHRRRPLLVLLGGLWHVVHGTEPLECASLLDAVVLWCKLVEREFGGRTEQQIAIDALLRLWHDPQHPTDDALHEPRRH